MNADDMLAELLSLIPVPPRMRLRASTEKPDPGDPFWWHGCWHRGGSERELQIEECDFIAYATRDVQAPLPSDDVRDVRADYRLSWGESCRRAGSKLFALLDALGPAKPGSRHLHVRWSIQRAITELGEAERSLMFDAQQKGSNEDLWWRERKPFELFRAETGR